MRLPRFSCSEFLEAALRPRANSEDEFACDQRHRAETHVKNAQVHQHRQERCAEEAGGQRGDVIHVADNLQIAATRGAEKLESKSSYVELKPNKFQKRTDLKTGRYKTEKPGKES